MAIRRQRAPRPGEILGFISGKRGWAWKAEDGRSGPHVRMTPAPCCSNAERGGSATINTASGLWSCFACGAKGNWFGFTRLAGYPLSDPYQDAPPVDFRVYDEIRSRLRRPVSAGHHPGLLAACQARGILPATLDAWRVTSAGPSAIRIPLFGLGETGWKAANARIRRIIDRDKATGPADWFEIKGGPTNLAMGNHLLGRDPLLRSQNLPFWLREWLDPTRETPEGSSSTGSPFPAVRRVLVLEGQWDAMTAYQLGIPNVLSMPNGASAVDVAGLLRYVPEDAEVWIGTDMDEAGDRAAELFFAQLGTKLVRLKLPFKDLNEWLMERPTLTADEVLATAGSDRSAGARDFSSLDEEDDEEVPEEIVVETPWPKLTRRLSGGFRAAQTTGLLAPSGTGKTTIANNIIAHAALSGVLTGVIQLEGTHAECKRNLRQQIMGWAPPDDEEENKRALLKKVILSDLRGKETTIKQTIAEVEALAKKGCRLIVVDNWDYITSPDSSGSSAKAKAYSAFQSLAKAYNFHGFVVWQPNKIDRAEKINSGSQKGLSTAFQDADVYITLNKYGLTRRLEVEKARVDDMDEESSKIWLVFDRTRRSLFETEARGDLKPIDLDTF